MVCRREGRKITCLVEDVKVGDFVLTIGKMKQPQWTRVEAVVPHVDSKAFGMMKCIMSGQDGITELQLTRNHKLLVQRGALLMPVRAEDLVCGEQLVNSVGQSLHVISLNPCEEFLVHEVETEAGTVLVNGVLVMATSVEVVKGVVVEELSSLMDV